VADQQDPAVVQEKGLVGSLIWADERQAERFKISKEITRGWEPFVIPQHRTILAALETVLGRTAQCDLPMLHGELAATGKLAEVGGAQALMDLLQELPNPDHVESYAKGVVRLASRRKALRLIRQINDLVVKGEDLNGELEELALASVEATDIVQTAKKKTWEEITGSQVVHGEQLLRAAETPLEYVVDPIVPRGYLTQIHGPPKGGKSSFTLFLGVATSIGTWPTGALLQSKPQKVFYITWEDMLPLISKRILSYARGLGSNGIPPNMHVTEMPLLLMNVAEHARALEDKISAERYDLVVLDTISHAHGVDEDKASEIKLVMQVLQRIARNCRCAILYVHHRRKNGEGVSMSERGRGSTAIGAAPVSIIDWGDRGDSDVTPVSITSKFDYRAKWEIEYIRQPDESVRWEIREQESNKKKRGGGSEGVLKALQEASAAIGGGEVPGKQIVAVMDDQGLSRAQVYRHLKALQESLAISAVVRGNATFYRLNMAVSGEK
jgi:DNA-binding transcriptional ArsR family regulator